MDKDKKNEKLHKIMSVLILVVLLGLIIEGVIIFNKGVDESPYTRSEQSHTADKSYFNSKMDVVESDDEYILTFSGAVDKDNIRSDYNNGILTIIVSKLRNR